MLLRLLNLLVCPLDKTPLELVEWEGFPLDLSKDEILRAECHGFDPILLSRQVVTGVLLNRARKIFYPIYLGIPRMLVFPTGAAREFVKLHKDRISKEIPDFKLPFDKPMPGEETVLRTFSREWVSYDWDDQTYWGYTPETIYRSMDFMLDLERPPARDKLVLEVGIGIGGIADHIVRAHGCELVGIDLSHAVDSAYRHFGKNPFLHIVQASAFATPFKENTFDLVYSQGVLHHTFSTRAAFSRICRLPKKGGRLYIWVYSPYDEQRTFIRRGIMIIENIIRPFCWRLPESLQTVALLPLIPLYLVHQNLHVTHDGSGYIKYGWREALHAARDRFTPRYAHRHTESEVCRWFREAGYNQIRCSSRRECPAFVPISFVTATAVDGVRE
jgi:SAM-dependent methyltransferase/uncharacterized protein YbaR (Trm112 family)